MTPLNLCLNEQLSIAEISYLGNKPLATQIGNMRLFSIQNLSTFTSSFVLKQMINENEINK